MFIIEIHNCNASHLAGFKFICQSEHHSKHAGIKICCWKKMTILYRWDLASSYMVSAKILSLQLANRFWKVVDIQDEKYRGPRIFNQTTHCSWTCPIKAFDSVPHERLLLKLQLYCSYGVYVHGAYWPGLASCFLTTCRQRVSLNGSSSSPCGTQLLLRYPRALL